MSVTFWSAAQTVGPPRSTTTAKTNEYIRTDCMVVPLSLRFFTVLRALAIRALTQARAADAGATVPLSATLYQNSDELSLPERHRRPPARRPGEGASPWEYCVWPGCRTPEQ